MLSNNIFYYGITRKLIVAFGSLFSNIKILREDQTKSTSQTINVPIAYAPKEKVLVRLDQDPTLDKYVYTTLPRLSFEITGLNYDATRRVNKGNPIRCLDDEGNLTALFAPVPYNIHISLYAITKTTEDGLQIAEQILPYFTPEFTLQVKTLEKPNIVLDIPVVLNDVELDDQYTGDFQTRRFVIWTFNFTLKANFFGPSTSQGIITHVKVDLSNMDNPDFDYAKLNIIGDPITGEVTLNEWNENLD